MISLKKITLIAVSSLIGAFYVSASEPVKMVNELAEKGKGEVVQLIAKFDQDNNGLLSKAEVEVSKNEALVKNFAAIDTNTDAGLSEEEIKLFIKK